MKHPKKKKRPRPSNPKSKLADGCQNPNPGQIDEQARVLNGLTEEIATFSIEEAISLSSAGNLTETASSSSANREDDNAENLGNLTETASSSSGSSGVSKFDGYNRRNVRKGSRGNRVVAATGMVATVLGKDYVPTSTRKRGLPKWKGSAVSHEDAQQFLCSMLSDDCELGMDVVKDVLCQSAYDIEKALDILLELTAPSSSDNQNHYLNAQSREDLRSLLESSDTLTDRASDLASSSESDLQGNVSYMVCNGRNGFDVLANCATHPSSGPKNSLELTQDVLEALFNTPKSSNYEPKSMNWRNIVKKIESLGQMLDYPTEEKQHVPGKRDDYQDYRNTASQHWDSMKSYYHKAATEYANGNREYAAYLSDQGRMCNQKARRADERASQEIFNSRFVIAGPIFDGRGSKTTILSILCRNKSIENVITIDLHGQHVKRGMKLLKLHLLFGAYVRSVRVFRVITGCGSHGLGKSKLKQSVVSLVEKEKIEWREENRGTLLIKLNEQREFSFLDSGSDSDTD